MENYNSCYVEKYPSGKLWYKHYRLNGVLHRLDGPAHIIYSDNKDNSVRTETYIVNSKIHRVDGPAVLEYNQVGSLFFETFYLLGHRVTKNKFYTPGFIDIFILENS
jgi:hypothetical protein